MSFTHLQEAALWDERGRCKCPHCGKFRRREQFPEQPSAIGGRGVLVIVDPACEVCIAKREGAE